MRAHDGPPTGVERVHAIFAERLGLRVPTDDTDVIAAGLIDSLGVAELILALEEVFEIEVDVATLSLDDLRTPAAVARMVDGLVGTGSP